MYCNVCNKSRKFKETIISYIFKKILSLSIVCSKLGHEDPFDPRSYPSLPDSSMGKNVIIFRADMSLSVHIDNKGKIF